MSKAKSKKATPRKKASAAKATATKKTASAKSAMAARRAKKEATPTVLPFGRMNYILLAAGVGIIALGFILMSMDDFVDATQFSVSLYIAPFVVVGGFVEIIYAILYKAPQEPAAVADADA